MRFHDMKPGMKVRIVRDVVTTWYGTIPAGTTGMVLIVPEGAKAEFDPAIIQLDQFFPELLTIGPEARNELQIMSYYDGNPDGGGPDCVEPRAD